MMKKQSEKACYVIYSRKSRYTGKGESVENQIEMCRSFISMHYGEKAAAEARVYEDEGFSGGNLERPQFKQMMKDSHSQKFEAIVVYRLDRISRNIGDFAKLIEELGDRGIGFISIKEQFDTSSPMGRAMMYIASVFSQLERETIAERIRDNMHELAKSGRWLGGNTPLGYDSEGVTKVTVDGKSKSAYRLVQIPEEIRMVERIFDKFLETGSLTKTDTYLLENRYRTRRGNDFTRFAIRGILTNPVYMVADAEAYAYLRDSGVDLFAAEADFDGSHGVMAYNRTLQRPGKGNQINPMEKWIVALGAHQGVVSGRKWVQVQKMLDQNREKGFRRPRSNEALLSGLLVCGQCGDFMRPKLTNRVNKDGERVYTYRCETRDRSQGHLCSIRPVDGNQLDRRLREQMMELSRDPEVFLRELEKGREALGGSREAGSQEIAELKKQIREKESAIASLMVTLPRYAGTDMEGYIMQQVQECHSRIGELKTRIGELETVTGESELQEGQFDLLKDMILRVGSRMEDMSIEQQRSALRLVVHKVVWDGENAHVFFLSGDCTLDDDKCLQIEEKPSASGSEDSWCADRK